VLSKFQPIYDLLVNERVQRMSSEYISDAVMICIIHRINLSIYFLQDIRRKTEQLEKIQVMKKK
jgi:hypothetical protein